MADGFKPHYSSTVFACDLSSDTRYIKCDFPQCSQHGTAAQAKPCWMLNTLKNVRILENHVGSEIHNFMKSQSLQCIYSESQHKTQSRDYLETKKLPIGTKKVLAVFNLKDSQSQLGEWLVHFLDAAFVSEHGDKRKDFVVLTQDFVSRYELMKSIANLEFLKYYSPKVDVICVLSCHSSSQGQVFSCTPSDISKEHGFEEFCSLHDLALSCQDAVGDSLAAIHISSCFTLKLDCSHKDWPVESSWLKNKLKCLLTGSIREVYETGSQVCDLHVLLSAILSPTITTPLLTGSCGDCLQRAIVTAQTESFPDLALEMGLEILSKESIDSKLSSPGCDDKVSPPNLVHSKVFVALLVEKELQSQSPSAGLSEAIQANQSPSVGLSEAIQANLSTRQASDIQSSYMVLPVTVDKGSSVKTKSSLKQQLDNLPGTKCKVLFVILGASLAYPSVGLVDAVRRWSIHRGGNQTYGIHFQEISALQAYYIKNRLKEEVQLNQLCGENTEHRVIEHIPITGLVEGHKNPNMAYPVLLYLIHLATGENGNRQSKKGLPTGVYSMKPMGPETSSWTLEEVYMETCHVLSGLSRKCSLQLLSLPVQNIPSLNTEDIAMETCHTSDDIASALICHTSSDNVVNIQEEPIGVIQTESGAMPECSALKDSLHGHLSDSHSPPVPCTSARQSDLTQKRSLDFEDEIVPGAKKLATDAEVEAESCAVNVNTTNNDPGFMKDYYELVGRTSSDHKQTRPEPDVVIIDDASDDDIMKMDSADTQANLDLPEPQQKGKKTKRSKTQNNPSTFKHDNREKEMERQSNVNLQQPCSLYKDHESRIDFREQSSKENTADSAEGQCSLTRKMESSEDIPLLANVNEVLVSHYVLDLSVDFDQQIMSGCIFLFIEPANTEATKKSFHICLDSTLVNIQSVSEVILPDDFKVPFFVRTATNIQPSMESRGSQQMKSDSIPLVEIIDDDDVPSSPDKSAVSGIKPDSSEGSELSLFQRLQRDYGLKIPEKNSTSTSPSYRNPRNNILSNSLTKDKECVSNVDQCNESKSNSTLSEFLDILHGTTSKQQALSFKGLKYAVYGWCIKVSKEGATGKAWPRCICIKYCTSPEGQSLTWTKDQDGQPCVFSPGAYINNRSLMPCQEPPVAMSTWQAAIHVPQGCKVYMSGCPITIPNNDPSSSTVTYYYEMDTPLPCSTLALAVGWFVSCEGSPAIVPTTQGCQLPVPCRIIAAPSLIEKASHQLLQHSFTYLVEACKLLGPYPFDRLDLLILPRCFACMGLKSPNLAFLSQSILSNDGSLRLRVAHEVTHAWFGLLIGAKDWTEEWLSEGFATYLEDTVQSRAERWSEQKDQDYREIRQLLRYHTLSAEMQVTERDMQCLRPKRTKQNSVERAEESNNPPDEEQPAPSTIIKYKCSKKWTQVHYLKGYFLLVHMETMVGRASFEKFLHDYVQNYRGQLVTSEDFFGYYLQRFPMLEGVVQDNFIREWLEGSGIPKSLRRKHFASKENDLVNEAIQESEFWRRQDTTNKRTKSKKRKEPKNITLQSSEQIVLMLEKLLQRERFLQTTLRQLNKVYQFASRNAEIRHRWCELVVKHKYTAELNDVKHFLIEDQGMGIYLFGELIISGQRKQLALAEEIFAEIGPEMDRCTFKTVTDMLEGVD